MSPIIKSVLIFTIPPILVASLSYLFIKQTEDASSPLDSRVRYLDIASGQKNRIDALPEMYLEGEINETLINDFNETVARHKLTEAKVVFNSNGGNLDDAIKLGYLIRSHGFSTAVGEYNQNWNEFESAGCYSSCTVAFLGGVYRYFNSESEFGVHQYRSAGLHNYFDNSVESSAQRFSGEFLEYILKMGVDSSFYQATVFQNHDGIYLLSLDDLLAMNVVNNGAYPAEWKLSMQGAIPALTGIQKRIGQDGTATLRCNQGIEIIFKSNRKLLRAKDADSMRYSLYTDTDEFSIDDKIQSTVIDGPDRHLLVSFKPESSLLLAIIGADSFGLIYEDSDGNRFLQNIDITSHRTKISAFIRNCQS